MISKLLSGNRTLTLVWVLLMILTLSSTLVAERTTPGALIVVFVCLSFAIKGSLVTEYLMELNNAIRSIRSLMLGYFILLPLLIGLAILFPDLLQRITTL